MVIYQWCNTVKGTDIYGREVPIRILCEIHDVDIPSYMRKRLPPSFKTDFDLIDEFIKENDAWEKSKE